MRYKSTRGNCPEVSFSEVLLGGLAPDGGLYMPTDFPFFSQEEIHSWSELKFYEIAAKVLYPYVEEEIEEIVPLLRQVLPPDCTIVTSFKKNPDVPLLTTNKNCASS